MLFKKKGGLGLLTVGIFLAVAPTASALVLNGSFEDAGGSFSGWNTIGDTQIQNSSLGTGPTLGTFDALIATQTDGSVNAGVPIGNGVGRSSLESFLKLSGSALGAVGNGNPVIGSAISQSLTLQAGDRISFSYDFLTNQAYYDGVNGFYLAPDATNNDFAFATLVKGASPAAGPITKLADTFIGYSAAANAGGFVTGLSITNSNNPFISETGFGTITLIAPTAGLYTLGIGVTTATTSATSDGVNSALLVDNVRIQSVPEPASYLAFGSLGLGLLFGAKRRRS